MLTMGRGIVRLAEDEYVEWSTVVDAPTTYAVGRREAVEEWGKDRIDRADRHGTSFLAPAYTLEDLVATNRAGQDEATVSLEENRRRFSAADHHG
jgi:hypothetical protein